MKSTTLENSIPKWNLNNTNRTVIYAYTHKKKEFPYNKTANLWGYTPHVYQHIRAQYQHIHTHTHPPYFRLLVSQRTYEYEKAIRISHLTNFDYLSTSAADLFCVSVDFRIQIVHADILSNFSCSKKYIQNERKYLLNRTIARMGALVFMFYSFYGGKAIVFVNAWRNEANRNERKKRKRRPRR